MALTEVSSLCDHNAFIQVKKEKVLHNTKVAKKLCKTPQVQLPQLLLPQLLTYFRQSTLFSGTNSQPARLVYYLIPDTCIQQKKDR